MKFIGLRLCQHDSNITYTDGREVKYCCTERNYQIKHHAFDDLTSWYRIIKKWNINPSEVDAIGMVIDCDFHPNLKTDDTIPYETLDIEAFKILGFNCPVFRVDHHLAHALSIWPIGKADLDLVFDGWGDDETTHSIFKDNALIQKYQKPECPSFGCIIGSDMFAHMFDIKGHIEDRSGKMMGLQSYGKYDPRILSKYSKFDIFDLKHVWSYDKFWEESREEQLNLLRLFHTATENIFANYFSDITRETRSKSVSFTGGIAQNILINTKIKGSVPNLIVPPHASDCGLSLGIVEFLRKYFDTEEFDNSGFPFWQDDEAPTEGPTETTIEKTSEMLAQGKIVGWYQGHGEIGPRALGHRSILMDPTIPNGKDIINQKVKHREEYRPFGASILEEDISDYFSWSGPSEYMLYTMKTLDPDTFRSITHIDGTCRAQTVNESVGGYYELLKRFKDKTGVPLLLNTSLNNNGKPIAGYFSNAFELLEFSDLDALVIGNKIYHK
ncbi:carbamoyltransferase [Synechococcus phage S-MbCM6]|uniref:Carbamoyltransferase n=1 Tax=Synechococcus phage ACG-2014c TaxID=1079998 RepID=A0A0E3ELB0_9CAUD|nr:carbamoyltransferase [Synechococcus phage ACG-2014c]AIX22945.1 carbamoyltransferase [Synechococcus phage ACG-2014c]AIX38177.1 carbamoyltransferase [Synechococcus phage ACG-2014c]